jgi:hypothetical protein
MAKPVICATCGTVGFGKRFVPGSIFIEIILWCCFLIPGLCYSIWRHSASKRVCRHCGSTELLPPSSPRGQALFRQYGYDKKAP